MAAGGLRHRGLCLLLVFFTLLFEGEPHHLFLLFPTHQMNPDGLFHKDSTCPPGNGKQRQGLGRTRAGECLDNALPVCCLSVASHRRPTVKQILSLVPVSVSEINIGRFFLCTLYTYGTSANGALCSLKAAIRGLPQGLGRDGRPVLPSFLPSFFFFISTLSNSLKRFLAAAGLCVWLVAYSLLDNHPL